MPSSHPSSLELHLGTQESCPSCEIGNQDSQTPQIYASGSRLATSSFWPFCQEELRICSSGQSNFLGGVYLVVEVEIKHRWFPIFCLEDTRESFAAKNLIQDFLVFHRS